MAAVTERVPMSAGGVAAGGGFAAAAAGRKTLNFTARLWFLLVFVGQLLFVIHIVSFYGRSAISGDFAHWNKALTVGYVHGDTAGNSALAAHLTAAAMISFGGLLQLIPQIRSRFPIFHRWNGRAYIVMAFVGAGSALYLQLIRGGLPGDLPQHSALVINALLIMTFAVVALRYALARQFDTHRRWAMRLFLVVSGSWFFRVGLFFWILINGRPVGFDPDKFQGPALVIISFLQFLLPLAVLELYLRAQRSAGPMGRFAVAGVLLSLTIAMVIGIFGFTMMVVSSGIAV
jgi:hypothetical protein